MASRPSSQLVRPIACLFATAFAMAAPAFAADIVLTPPPTGGVSVTNSTGLTTRFRVGDEGIITLPGLGAVPVPATGLCLEIATGRLGTCALATGTVTGVTASAPLASSGGATPNLTLTGGAAGQVLAGTGGAPAWTGSPSLSGNLELVLSTASAGNIIKNGARYIHSIGGEYTFYAGTGAGGAADSATGNTAVGGYALFNNASGGSNTAIGAGALGNTSNGSFNVMVGGGAGTGLTIGDFNTVVGTNSFSSTTTATQNTGVGGGVLQGVTSGILNTALGYGAGSSITTGNFNIAIGNNGNAADSGVIRIGNFLQSKAFVAAVRGVTTDLDDAVGVMISSNGQLGTVSSSRRFKDDIADMADASAGLMDLRPVTFTYQSDSDPSGRRLQYGLVAEEVAQVYPGLVATGPQGQAETVMYHFLAPMLVNEYQKQQRTIDTQAAVIASQSARLESVEAELAAIKRALGLAR